MRRILAILTLSALTVACTVTTDGTVVAAPTLGHAPQPLRPSALTGLLLEPGDIDSIMNTSGLKVVDSDDAMYTNRPLEDGCLVWAEAQEHVYAGSGWTAVRLQKLSDDPDHPDHLAYQAVVSYPHALDAHDFYAGQVTSWAGCDNRRVDLHDADDPNSHYWSLSKASDHDGILTIVRVEEGGGGWACQRAFTAANNIVIDVSACADNVGDRGTQIATRIAKKVSEKQ
jgi:hypothetical protein